MINELFFPFAVFAVLGIIVAISFFYSKKNRILRELKKSPSKPINTVKDREYVRLHGKVEAINKPFIAPLSKRPCVYYHIIVERQGDKNWHKVIDDFKYSPFYLNCGGEKARVHAHDKNTLLFHLVVDHNRRSGWSTKPTQAMKQYLESQHYDGQTWLFKSDKTLRYKEAILHLGEHIVVKGNAQWKRLDTPLEGFNFSRLLELHGTLQQRLIITDLPKALRTLPKKS